MRKLILIWSLLLSIDAFAQSPIKEYYNENWKMCDSATAKFYRLITYDDKGMPVGTVVDYYMDGARQWEGRYFKFTKNNMGENQMEGSCTWFYPSGKRQRTAHYENGVVNGTVVGWFENGNRMHITNFKSGLAQGLSVSWFESGLLRNYAVFDKGIIVGADALHCDEFGECDVKEQFAFSKYDKGMVYRAENMSRFLEVQAKNNYGNSNDARYEVRGEVENFIQGKGSSDIKASRSKKTKGLLMQGGKKGGTNTIFRPWDYEKYWGVFVNLKIYESTEPNQSGLVFAYSDAKNYQYFTMSGKGEYEIGGYKDGSKNITATGKLSANKYSSRKSGASFYMRVVLHQDTLRYFCDNELLYKRKGAGFSGENIGFYLAPKSKVLVTNTLLRYDADPPFISADVDKNSLKKAWKGSGSGIVVSQEGHIITNHHVVNDTKEIQIDILRDGKWESYDCELLIKDEKSDLAVIKIKDSTFKSFQELPYSIKTQLADVGTEVFTLGYPLARALGNELKYMEGTVNARTGYQGELSAYQISVPLQPGNSGGPLFDKKGNLVAVVNSRLNNASNVGFAIKSNYILNLTQMLPAQFSLPSGTALDSMSTEEQVQVLREFIPMIKVR